MQTSAWHALPPQEVLSRLRTRPEGLSAADALLRRETHGENVIRSAHRVSPVRIFLAQFTSSLVYILLIAALVSFATGHATDGWVILAIVLLNAVIGFFQEYKAERALAALRALAAPQATVRRDGRESTIPAVEVVPGDVVLLAAGDRVPADARVLVAANLQAQEAALTGESQPSRKHPDPAPEDAPLAERRSMLFLGTAVVTGRGEAVVTATGMDTEMGTIAREVASEGQSQTPLQRKLGALGGRLGVAAVGLAAVLVAVGLLRRIPLEDLFFTGIAAAVAFIPEGLPAVVTVVLAVGVQRMVRRNAIIRKLPAVEALGSATFICTDKTGTLTRNEMTVRTLWLPGGEISVEGEGYVPEGAFQVDGESADPREVPGLTELLRAVALCNDARLEHEGGQWRIAGDPTEGALLVAAHKAGFARDELAETYPRLDEVPFDPDERYMATLHAGPGGERWLFAKGAPERVVGMCGQMPGEMQSRKRNEEELPGPPTGEGGGEHAREANLRLASQALRVLAFAGSRLPPETEKIPEGVLEGGLTFLGLAGMIDPPRPEAATAIEAANRAGIQVMMITGDHPATAHAIAEQLGLLRGDREVVDGHGIAAMSDDELRERVERIAVCARAEPTHKLRIVKALQECGHIVAMTGDGVNDAPALKRADIGVAMGITGTDVAKESGEMVLADDNFASIVGAVEEGRVIFNNIRRVVLYLLSTNSGEILTLLASIAVGLPLPLLPVQILWINLVTDGAPTIGLGQEPPHGRVLDEPPRDPDAPIIPRSLVYRIGFVALFMAVGTIALFAWALENRGMEHARTLAFVTMSAFQLFNVYNARSIHQSVGRIGLLSNPWVTWGVLGSALLLVAAIYVPFLQTALRTVPLGLGEWGVVLLVASSVVVAEEIRKAVAPGLFGTETNAETRVRRPARRGRVRM